MNEGCRAALIDTIFFSPDHEKLRHCLIGPKFSLTQNLLLCPNGPNVKPTTVNLTDEFVAGRRTTMKTAVPSFLDH